MRGDGPLGAAARGPQGTIHYGQESLTPGGYRPGPPDGPGHGEDAPVR